MSIPYPDLVQQLRRQLVFLRNSVAAYDKGHIEEAIRIAVVIRVLCHDTGVSTSLLQHMGKKATLRLASTAQAIPANLPRPMHLAELMSGMTFGNTIDYNPVPNDTPTIACSEWWGVQPVFIRNDIEFTRKDIVLSASNKDGGAHIDAPDSKLLAFKDGFWIKKVTAADGTITTESLGDHHLRMLRRIGEELLCSRELLALSI